MSGITAWWDGIPGLDSRVPFVDALFANRMAALTIAMRVCGTDPSAEGTLRPVANVADRLLDWLQAAETERDGYIRRFTLAIASTNLTGKPGDVGMPRGLIRAAERYREYLTQPADKRGGWI